MIVDRIDQSDLYDALGKNLAKALRFLRETDLDQLPDGLTPIDGDDLYARVRDIASPANPPADAVVWEAHRDYYDLHAVLEGCEKFGYADIAALRETQPYDPAGDCLLLGGRGDYLLMRPGWFVLVGPRDAHAPNLAAENPARLRKVVVKVRIG